ncbi:Sialidase [Ustulina deusta]|nr:Sialidase [Ustulina deusta]
MRYKSAGFLFVTVAAALSTPLKDSPQPFGVFSNNVIYQPSPPEVLYLRFVEISDGKLLVTSMLSGYSPAFSLVFESADGGMDLGYQDSGERLGHVGQAGADGAIRVYYYNNQRDPLHRQKLVHQTSTDLKNWGPVVNGVAYGNYSVRLGQLSPACLQLTARPSCTSSPAAPTSQLPTIPYTTARRRAPWNSTAPTDSRYCPKDGIQPSDSPYITWSSVDTSTNGTIIVSDADYHQPVFVN